MNETGRTSGQQLEKLVERILRIHPAGSIVARGSEPDRALSNCVVRLADQLGVSIVESPDVGRPIYSVYRIFGGPGHMVALEDSYRSGTGAAEGLSEQGVLSLLECYVRMCADRSTGSSSTKESGS